MQDDFGTLTVPRELCYVCAVPNTAPGDACARCGATVGDVRLLLRAGANAYADARDAALAYRFADARKLLRVARSLGLGQSRAWQELALLVEAADPPVSAKEAADYALAHHLAKERRYDAAQQIALPQTPITATLRRISQLAESETRQQYGVSVIKYLIWGICCVLVGIIARC